MNDLEQRINQLSSGQLQSLLKRIKRQPGTEPKGLPALVRTSGERRFPLSFAQQRLHFLQRLEPESAAYHLQTAVRLSGELSVEALSMAFQRIVDRHEGLRTRFIEEGGEPRQEVVQAVQLHLERLSLSDRSAADQSEALEQAVRAFTLRPFELTEPHLLRIQLVRLSLLDHVLVICAHHIISDHWTWTTMLREFTENYRALVAGVNLVQPPLTIQYGDYAAWQRQTWTRERLEPQLRYWRERLQDAPLLLELPLDRARPPVQTYHGDRVTHLIDAKLTEGIRGLASREGVTLFMALLAGFQVLLGRYARQPEVVVGTAVAGRSLRELEVIAGMFVNNLVLRASLGDNPSFRRLLATTKQRVLEAFSHQELPFEALVEGLQPQRSLSYPPLFQTFFILQSTSAEPPELPGLQVEPYDIPVTTAKFELTLEVWPSRDRLRLELEYNTDLFERATVERLLANYERLLGAAVATPELPALELPLVSLAEHAEISSWSQTQRDFGPARLVHELVLDSAAQRPDAVAIECGGETRTYQELVGRAQRIAGALHARGVARGQRVAVCMERSVDLAAALLGILMTGAAYVPIDPELPVERKAYMLADLGDALLVTAGECVPAGARAFRLEEVDGSSMVLPCQATATPHDPVYLIYTSGSTGRPKGVEIEHRNAVNFLRSMAEAPGLGASDVMLSVTTMSFDIFVLELFLPLSTGAKVVLATRQETRDGRRLCAMLKAHHVTVMQATPSTWRLLLAADWGGHAGLTALCGGEAMPNELAAALHGRVAALWNMYGPTETTVWSCIQRVTDPNDITIGRPIANTTLRVLDERRQPVPIGVPGELWIGGDGVARGYYERAELTAERFVSLGESGERFYRTGDLVRFRADGQLLYLGRLDHQVKVRGFRIELGEIESVLAQNPSVEQAVAVVRRDRANEDVLVAYVGGGANVAELREYCRRLLPEYMVPSVFFAVQHWPTTPNGKIDRAALPDPFLPGASEQGDGAAPLETRAEQALAELWSELLVTRPAPSDDFFSLGGHSLLAMRLVTRVRETLGVELPLKTIFEKPVLREMATLIEEQVGTYRQAALVARADLSAPVPLSFAQQRLWFLQRLDPGGSAYNVPAAVLLEGSCSAQLLERALTLVVDRHEALRTSFELIEDQPRQRVLEHVPVQLVVTTLAEQVDSDRQAAALALVEQDARRSFELALAPLFRARLVQIAPDRWVFGFTMHHVVTDGWSQDLFVRDLGCAYDALAAGRVPEWQPLSVGYTDFAIWERANTDSDALQQSLQFWAQELRGAPPYLDIPSDLARPAEKRYRGHDHFFTLNSEVSDAIRCLARRLEATPFMVFMAAWLAVLHRHSGEPDLLVGMPVAGRKLSQTEQLMGCFVNTVVLRGDVSGDPTFCDLVVRVRERVLQALAHDEVPFERLVQTLQPERDLARTPLFQVLFSMQSGPTRLVQFCGGRVTPLNVHTGAAQCDLALMLREGDQEIFGHVEYDTDLFNSETAARFAQDWCTLLERVVSNPEIRCSLVAPLSERALRTRGQTAVRAPELPLLVEERREPEPEYFARRLESPQWESFKRRCEQADVDCADALLSVFAHTIGYFSSATEFELVCWSGKRGWQLRTFDTLRIPSIAGLARAQRTAPERAVAPSVHTVASVMVEDAARTCSAVCLDSVLDHRVVLDDHGSNLTLRVRSGRLPRGFGRDWWEVYLRVVDALVAGEAAWEGRVPLELPEEQARRRAEFHRTAGPMPSGVLHARFCECARRNPGLTAVVTPERVLTYGELDQISTAIARDLRGRGARPNRLVGILAEKGWQQIVAVYAVLKSGAAYLPLDPDWPRERLAAVLEQAEADLVLSHTHLLESIESSGITVLPIEAFSAGDREQLESTSGADDLAYVLFTSGSTGIPKGVALGHRGPLNTILAINERLGITPADRVLGVSSLTFDLSVYDLFGPLAAGAAIVLPRSADRLLPGAWHKLIDEHRVTIWNSVPALAELLVDCLEQQGAQGTTLKHVILSGDWIPVTLPDRLRARFRSAQIYGAGGPTETSIWSIFYPIAQVDPKWPSIPYGKPLRNQRVHVLDSQYRPCPEWVTGRMYVSGVCLARGYWRESGHTAERFRLHPETNERLYWTGDLGRHLPDGNIEFRGREDFQIKLHGQRIELEEIELALLRSGLVESAAVVVARDRRGTEQLAVHFVPTDPDRASGTDLENVLRRSLPDYMVPRLWFSVRVLPLSVNGKIDRRALATLPEREPVREFLPARTAPERALAEIWCDMLRAERVGVNDDFFEIGGDSLLAVAVVERARRAGLEFTLRDVFQARTIAALIGRHGSALRKSEQPGFSLSDVPLLPLQRWYLEEAKHRTRPERWNVNALVAASRPVDAHLLRRAFTQVCAAHPALRARFEGTGSGSPRQRLDEEWGETPFEIVCLGALSPEQRALELSRQFEMGQNEFELSAGRLVRMVLFEVEPGSEYRVWLCGHHLVLDGVSAGVVLREVGEVYEALVAGREPPVLQERVSFAEWAEMLTRWAKREVIEAERAYWLGLPWNELAPLPTDYAVTNSDITVDSVRQHDVRLDGAVTRAILRDGMRRLDARAEDLLLAAFLVAVGTWTGRSWHDVMVLHAGRDLLLNEGVDAGNTVGWLSSERLLVIQVSQGSCVEQTRAICAQIRAVPHGGHGYNWLRFSDDAELATELAQRRIRPGLLFNYRGQLDSSEENSNWRWARESTGWDEDAKNARFNLLELHGFVEHGELCLQFRYSRRAHAPATIERLARAVQAFLVDVVGMVSNP